MKLTFIFLIAFFSVFKLRSQTNIFPANGNVGIGTNNATSKLTVDPQGEGGIVIGNPNTAGGGFTSLSIIISAIQAGYSSLQSIKSSGSAYGDLCLNPLGGNIGIGTALPTAKLAVKGNIRAQEVKVEASNWPDYVFEDDYQIKSLSDIKKYILANKHLPDMPSAKQVRENGIDLGDMNSRLLKKIEELTLHLIEKDKEIGELKLEKQINLSQQIQIDELTKKFQLLTKEIRK